MEINIERSPQHWCPSEGSNSELFAHENDTLTIFRMGFFELFWDGGGGGAESAPPPYITLDGNVLLQWNFA